MAATILTAAQSEQMGRSGGSNVTVQIVNNTQAEIREERATDPNGEDFRRFVIEAVGDALASGGFDKQQQSRFGISPQRIRR